MENTTQTTDRHASTLVAALEDVWAQAQERHPEIPDVVLIVGQGTSRSNPGLVKLGHYAHGRWDVSGAERPEVLVGGEGLQRGAADVLGTLLHEAAHGVAAATGVQDTSRGGRYHNARFKAIAEALGLTIERHPVIGWSLTSVPTETTEAYDLDALEAALVLYRRAESGVAITGGPGTGGAGGADGAGAQPKRRGNVKAVCECGRAIRIAPSVLAAGAITCGVCQTDFTEEEK